MLKIVENPDSGLVVSSIFLNPEELIECSLGHMKDMSKGNNVVHTSWYDDNTGEPPRLYVNTVIHEDGTGIVLFGVDGVYENGVVYSFFSPRYDDANKYSILTSAKLVVKNDGEVIYLIDGLDESLNTDIPHEVKKGRCIGYNTDKYNEIIGFLGDRIDSEFLNDNGKRKGIFERHNMEKATARIYEMISDSYRTVFNCVRNERKEGNKIIK